MIGCLVSWKCAGACFMGESLQQPTCPHSAQRRRCSHQPLPDAKHSTQPVPLGFTVGLTPSILLGVIDILMVLLFLTLSCSEVPTVIIPTVLIKIFKHNLSYLQAFNALTSSSNIAKAATPST